MAKDDLRIIYFGTPDFAVNSLKIIVENGYNVVAVVTSPDNIVKSDSAQQFSAIKKEALNLGIPILQPENLKDEKFLSDLKSYDATLYVVVAFKILPKEVWQSPKYGAFNLHASYLPNYRGAAPINWAIINGEKETGLTTFFLQDKVDTGDIILQKREFISDDDTFGTLYEKLKNKGAELVLETIKLLEIGNYSLKKQEHFKDCKPAPKINKELGEINFNCSANEIHNLCKGLSPLFPIFFIHNNKTYKVYKTSVLNLDLKVGEIKTDEKNYLYLGTFKGVVSVIEIQPPNKRKMSIKDFFRGYKL